MKKIESYKLVSEQVSYAEIKIILNYLNKVLNNGVCGQIVEFGCYNGTTSLFISRLLKEMGENREFHVYDSFEGLPNKSAEDDSVAGNQFSQGELKVTKSELLKNYRQAGLPIPYIHKSWFSELKHREVPTKICFAFLDGDFYDSIKDSLSLIENKLQPGAVIIVDDYQSEALPGAQKAVNQWLTKQKSYKMHHEQSLAIIRCIL